MISVLIVDDHPLLRTGLREAIESQPDLCVVADLGSGEEAVAHLADQQVDVVLMDLNMAGMGGAAATAAINASDDPPGVVVFTTFATDADLTAAFDAGARGYLLKDALPEYVFDAIRRVAAGGAALSPAVADRVARDRVAPSGALSARELDVLELLAQGLGNRAIAKALHVSEATVKTHLVHVFEKLDVDNRTAAVVTARATGVIR